MQSVVKTLSGGGQCKIHTPRLESLLVPIELLGKIFQTAKEILVLHEEAPSTYIMASLQKPTPARK
jgi:hypothetical protein